MLDEFKAARLTPSGINEFRNLITRGRSHGMLKKETIDQMRRRILKRKDCLSQIPKGPKVDGMMVFKSKADIATHALTVARASNISTDPNADETGFWSWMALVHFWQITKIKANGKGVRPHQNYIPETGSRRFYKHFVGGPAWMQEQYGNHAAMLLHQPAYKHGDNIEQLLGNGVTSRSLGVMEAAHRLFHDVSESNGMRKGSNPNNATDLGLRYLVRKLQQLACTHDIRSMAADDIIVLFPNLGMKFPPKTT